MKSNAMVSRTTAAAATSLLCDTTVPAHLKRSSAFVIETGLWLVGWLFESNSKKSKTSIRSKKLSAIESDGRETLDFVSPRLIEKS